MKKTILILTGLILASVVFASKTVTRRDSDTGQTVPIL